MGLMRFRMSRLLPYGLAAAASVVAQCVKLLVGPVLLPSVFLPSYGAVLFSAWYGGSGPGVLAAVLCGLWSTALFLPLHLPPHADEWSSVARGLLFVGTATLLSWAFDRNREAMREARALKELRESEERYRELVENLNDIIFSLDAVGKISYISPVVEELSGYSPAEVTGHSFAEFIHPDDIALASESLQRTFQGILEPLDFRLVAKDGSVLWVRSSSRAIFAGESLVGVRGVIRDMTDRRRAEEALRESEKRFRALIEHSSDLISVIRADGTFGYFSPSIKRLLGYEPEELVGTVAFDLVHPDDREQTLAQFADMLEQRSGTSIGLRRFRHKDGSWRWLEAVGTNLLSEPGIQMIVVNSRDVTDRKRAEEDLRESEERFRKIFEESPLGMAIVSTDNRFLRVNNTLCQIAGYSQSELVGRTFADISDREDVDIERNYAHQLLDGKIPGYQLEKRCIRRDGQAVWVNLSASVIRNAQGTPLYGIAMIQNINDRKRAEAEVHERQAELAHVLRVATMNEMGTTLAHELNQPLAAIINYANGCIVHLRSGTVVADDLAQAQEEIAAQAERAARVIRRLRAFVRREPPRREWLDLNQLIREAVSFLTAEVRARGIALGLELAAGLPPVHVDRVQMEQVILNLIRNGLDALGGPDAGCRELSIRTSTAGDGSLEVAVHDTGAGLPSAVADLVFTPFFTTKPDGLGMGLSISRLIVEAHGGRLWATPQPDRGTTFKFKLPADCIGLTEGD